MPVETHTDQQVTDTRLWLYDPTRAAAALVLDWKDLEIEMGPFLQGTLTVTVHKDSTACTALDANSNSALSTDWGWTDANNNGLWSFNFYYRGTLVFMGPVVVVKKQRESGPEDAYVTLVCEHFYQHLMRRRQVRTETGIQYSDTDEISDVFRQLVREQCETGNIITPTGSGARQAYPAAESRDDFGSFTVTVEADTNTGTSITYKTDDKTNLLDSLNELCTMTSADTDWLWPTLTETSAGTFRVGVNTGRSGGSREIGTDLSSTVMFTSGRRTLLRFSKVFDGTIGTNLWTVTGKGRGSSQRARHITNGTMCDRVGVIEDALNISQGGTNQELDDEAQRLINDQAVGWITWEQEIVETTGFTFPANFDIADTVVFYDDAFAETLTDMIIGFRLSVPTPGPAHLILKVGRIQRNPLRELGRSGGGGGGGRGGGGRPRMKHGESDQDPDSIFAFKTVTGDAGVDAVADQVDDSIDFTGDSGRDADEIYAFATTADDPESVAYSIHGNPTAEIRDDAANVAFTHYITITTAPSGTRYRIYLRTDTP